MSDTYPTASPARGWASASFDVEEFRAGTEVELYHGPRD
jgi:hypothetical protein